MYKTIGRTNIRGYIVSTISERSGFSTTIWHKFCGRPIVVALTRTRQEAISAHRQFVRFCVTRPQYAFDVVVRKEFRICLEPKSRL